MCELQMKFILMYGTALSRSNFTNTAPCTKISILFICFPALLLFDCIYSHISALHITYSY